MLFKENPIKWAILTSLVLCIIKAIGAFFTGSLILLSSALDSFFDSIISFSNALVLKKAKEKPTKYFPFGFGKLEGLAGLFQGLFILSSGGIVIFLAIKNLFQQETIELKTTLIGIIVFSIGCTLVLTKYLHKKIQKMPSLILESEIHHYRSDIIAYSAFLMGAIVMNIWGWDIVDSLISFAAGVLIAKEGTSLLKSSVENLLDKKVDPELEKKITTVLQNAIRENMITGYHYLKARKSGIQVFIEAHLVFTENILLAHAHKKSEMIEERLHSAIPFTQVTFHLDPKDDSKEELEKISIPS